ncbi:MAG: DegT/DnrJ/EryC1/StrS family aminotransferase [Chloroflexi bacterium]|nr:DegT/DnrJ/EryC1/StrS family aminotransferase [Chloroflexota bacterium]
MATSKRPAALGGKPMFSQPIPLTQPTLPKLETLLPNLERMFDSRMITNSKYVRELEEKTAAYFGVKHVVALSSCTSGLILVWRAYGLKGEVILPSYTFSATGLALLWNDLRPRFVEIDPKSLNVNPDEVEKAIGPDTVGILAVHIWGNPAYPTRLEAIARAHRLKLVFDSAHGLGAHHNGRPIGGFGDAEIFSLSPTKLVVGSEGGLVATNDGELARLLRIGRDYGNPGNYNLEFAGMNARMPEFNALLTMRTFEMMEVNLARRQYLVSLYRARLGELPGLMFQEITPDSVSSSISMGIVLDPDVFGVSRNQLAKALEAEGITSRKYYDPVLHHQRLFSEYRSLYDGRLPITERVEANVLCLPLFSHMQEQDVEKICQAIEGVHVHRKEIRSALT